MPLTFLELFQHLASFNPPKRPLREAPWDAYVDWAIANGLAPLAAYNLEYRLGLSGAPQWVKDRLLSVYQAVANDNVMKLVNFKRTIDELEGRRLIVLGGACFAESLYPHVAFRPLNELAVWVSPKDVDPLVNFLKHSSFQPVDRNTSFVTLSDTRTTLLVYHTLFGGAADVAFIDNANPMPVYGASAYRLDLESTLLVEAKLAALARYELPRLQCIDVRELAIGAPSTGGFYSRPPDIDMLQKLAHEHDVREPLWTLLSAAALLFPEARPSVEALLQGVGAPAQRNDAEDNVKRLTFLPFS